MPTDFLYPVPELPPDEGTLWVVAFNAEWLPIVVDAVDNLQRGSLFDVPPADIEEQVDQLVKLILTPYVCPPTVTTLKRSFVLHQDSKVINGNPISFTVDTGQALNGVWRQSTAAQNDEWSNGFYAPAGNYIIRYLCSKSSASGILYTSIDGILTDNFDMYNASTQLNVVHDITLAIDTDGYHVINGKLSTKNALSSGYVCRITSISIIPQGTE